MVHALFQANHVKEQTSLDTYFPFSLTQQEQRPHTYVKTTIRANVQISYYKFICRNNMLIQRPHIELKLILSVFHIPYKHNNGLKSSIMNKNDKVTIIYHCIFISVFSFNKGHIIHSCTIVLIRSS